MSPILNWPEALALIELIAVSFFLIGWDEQGPF